MQTKITQKDISILLQNLGITIGDSIEVHCALSSFGYVDGGAKTIINALKESVSTSGSIVMPAFNLSTDYPLNQLDIQMGITTKIKYLTDNNQRSAMGIVADTFRRLPDTLIGEGLFRVAAWGKDAGTHVLNGFQHIIDNGGKAVLLGVDIYKLSAMHYVENYLPEEIKDKFKPSKEVQNIYPESEWLIETWSPTCKPWYKIQEKAEQLGYIKSITINNCTCMTFEVKKVVELYKKELIKNAFDLYGLDYVTN